MTTLHYASALAVAAALALAPLSMAESPGQRSADPVVLGFVETVFLGELKLQMSAKLDTGADTSSVYARDIKLFEKSRGDDWVRFRLIGDDGRTIRFEKNVVRFALIKTKRGGTIRRPVVLLDVCVGGLSGVAEFNLADRDQFDYDVLIGREFLASRILVDAGRRHLGDGACEDYLASGEEKTDAAAESDAAGDDEDEGGAGDTIE